MTFWHLVLYIFLWSDAFKKAPENCRLVSGLLQLSQCVWKGAALCACPFQPHPWGIDAMPFCLGIRNQKYRRPNWRMAAWETGLFPLRKTSKYLCTILVILEPDMNTYIQAMHCIHSCLLQYLSCAEFVQRIAGLSPWSNKSLQVFPYLYLLKGNTPLQGLLLHSCD